MDSDDDPVVEVQRDDVVTDAHGRLLFRAPLDERLSKGKYKGQAVDRETAFNQDYAEEEEGGEFEEYSGDEEEEDDEEDEDDELDDFEKFLDSVNTKMGVGTEPDEQDYGPVGTVPAPVPAKSDKSKEEEPLRKSEVKGKSKSFEKQLAEQLSSFDPNEINVADKLNEQNEMQAERAVHTKNAAKISVELVQLRQTLQKVIQICNTLPISGVVEKFKESVEVNTAYQESTIKAVKTMNSFIDLHHGLCARNSAIPPFKKRKRDCTFEDVQNCWSVSQRYCDEELNNWHSKAADKRKKTSATERTTLENIRSSFTDMPRLIERSQHNRLGLKRIGSDFEDLGEDERCKEIYDDSDFYANLLADMINSGAGKAGLAAQITEKQKLQKMLQGTKRKATSQRAHSKGKGLNKEVQEKLINFMVPRKIELPSMTESLFSNLFSHLE